jgi:hypothetical protein
VPWQCRHPTALTFGRPLSTDQGTDPNLSGNVPCHCARGEGWRALHFNGETIPLIPENSRKVTAAVAELRKSIQNFGPSLRIYDRIAELDKRCTARIAEFEAIASNDALAEARLLFNSALCRVREELARVALENGLK